jgi:hypothetical protein
VNTQDKLGHSLYSNKSLDLCWCQADKRGMANKGSVPRLLKNQISGRVSGISAYNFMLL